MMLALKLNSVIHSLEVETEYKGAVIHSLEVETEYKGERYSENAKRRTTEEVQRTASGPLPPAAESVNP